jgi:low temperature requirement protein LtrA
MSCLFGYTTNITTSFDPDSDGRDTYTQLIAFFIAARAYNGLYFLLQAYMAPIVRGFMFGNAINTVIPSALWIASIYVEMPNRLGLISVALALDIFAHPLLIVFIRYSKYFSDGLGEWTAKVFDFYPAVNIEHKTERTKQFVTLVFGYSVVALLYQNSASMGVNGFFGKAVLGIVQTFCQNWIYFEIDGARIHVHAIRRHVATSKHSLKRNKDIIAITKIPRSDNMEHVSSSIHYG